MKSQGYLTTVLRPVPSGATMKAEDPHMGKYAKFALVLLYVVQLAVLFRDQLIHLYKDAVEAAHRQSSLAHHRDASEADQGPRVSLFLKRASPVRFNPKAALFALPGIHGLTAISVAHHEGGHHDHDAHGSHDDDKHKDRPKKRIIWPPRVLLFANLISITRNLKAHPDSIAPRPEEEMLSLLIPEAVA
jgi:hypothetical protein